MPPYAENTPKERFVEVDLKKLPAFTSLRQEVNKVINSSSNFERYGHDLCYTLGAVLSVPFALALLKDGGTIQWIVATLMLGTYHCIVANKTGHLNAHGSLSPFPLFNDILGIFSTEFVGSYSYLAGYKTHIQGHHPHTNIIGLGDSSMWKIPQLSRLPYLFIAPFLLPLLTPIVAIGDLILSREWRHLVTSTAMIIAGISAHIYVIMQVTGYSFWGAAFYLNLYRSIFSWAFLHINIFQHIGLPMYHTDSRPARIYQMSSGVLNLWRNPILDHVMGHSLVNCHVEHHLFPRLSDNMCLKVKPTVEKYLKEHGLPYNEDSYMSRLKDFWNRYDELMVNAPPITHFVGIQ